MQLKMIQLSKLESKSTNILSKDLFLKSLENKIKKILINFVFCRLESKYNQSTVSEIFQDFELFERISKTLASLQKPKPRASRKGTF
jgi:hypothetical protein